jgi:hypothetical protein
LLFFSSSSVNKAAAQEGDTEILKLLEKESTVNRALNGNTDSSSMRAQSALCQKMMIVIKRSNLIPWIGTDI